jgi:hypothetical protein
MAYVRKTDTLCYDIRENVRTMKDKALQAHPVPDIKTGTADYRHAVESIMTASYADAPELKGKLPDSWLKRVEKVEVEFVNEDEDSKLTHNFTVSVHTPTGEDLLLPPSAPQTYYGARVEMRRKDMTEGLCAWLDGANAANARRRTIAEQFDNVEQQLTAYMRQHASLNAAVKEMPEMEMYVPPQYIDKMREATIPRKKKSGSNEPTASEELGIDRNALATMAIAHRLTQ